MYTDIIKQKWIEEIEQKPDNAELLILKKVLCFEEKELYAILDTDRIILNSSYDGKESEACMNTLDLYLSTEYPDFTTTTQVQSR